MLKAKLLRKIEMNNYIFIIHTTTILNHKINYNI